MRLAILSLPAIALLAACAPPPVVSAFNGDSVTVESYAAGRSVFTDAEAANICARGGKPVSEFLSTRETKPGVFANLYACLDA